MRNDSFWAKLGPGLLFAGAAIGVSHTVQSTRAGAVYGLGLLVVVLLANLLKYPSFRFGPHFAAVTGMSLVESYARQNRGISLVLGIAIFATQSIIVAAVAITTAGIANAAFGLSVPAIPAAGIFIAATLTLLYTGGYRLAERASKVSVVIVTVATLIATVVALPEVPLSLWPSHAPALDTAGVMFVFALVGLMPAGGDLAVMHSLWIQARGRAGESVTMPDVTMDFNVGYIGTTLIAVCFLVMGAGVLFAQGIAPVNGAVEFGVQVLSLYSASLGPIIGAVVGVALFMVIFSTLLAILDGFPRITASFWLALRSADGRVKIPIDGSRELLVSMVMMGLGAMALLLWLMASFTQFIDLTAVATFLLAPFLAVLNHRAVFGPDVPLDQQPTTYLRLWSWIGILFLFAFTLLYLWMRFLR